MKHSRQEDTKKSPHHVEEEEDDMPMPMPMTKSKKKQKTLPFLDQYLKNMPMANMYEKSYMHRDVVTHTVITPKTQFLVTASKDGHLKFWKKMNEGIEFVKHYKAHSKSIEGLCCSSDGLYLCTTSEDQSIKFYDVVSFDMVNMIQVPYLPTCCVFAYNKEACVPKVAVADRSSPLIRIYPIEGSNDPIFTLSTLHRAPVVVMAYNSAKDCVISGDEKGILEYWNTQQYTNPTLKLDFKFKMDTDLFELAKSRTMPTSLVCSPDGESFAVTAKDKQVRIFRFKTGKMKRKYDESIPVFEDAQADGSLHLDEIDFGRRLAVEKDLNSSPEALSSNCIFDETGHFILFPTLLGIKVINVETNKLVRVLGRVENTERFLAISMFQGIPKVSSQTTGSQTKIKVGEENKKLSADPIVFCTAFKKNRFFLFSNREPLPEDESGEGRDVFNEKPSIEDSEVVTESSKNKLGNKAVLHTTNGDIFVKLFPDECPRTVENFCTHARNGYYDNLIFHRVIKNFMVQTGDPMSDGTGGESIWGGEFEDEFHRNLRHDRAFTLSMANAGPNTNGSQFFITTVPTPWLDNKHTVFGRVENGMDTVSSIEQTPVDKYDKPYDDIKIINIDIS